VSFRARLVLGAAYLLTAVVLALEIPLALNVDRRATSEYQSAVLGNAAVLASRGADLVTTAGTAPARATAARRRLRGIVREASVTQRGRTVVTNRDGRVLADTAGSTRAGEAYATQARPELRTALFAGRIDIRRRTSETLGEELLLVTVPVVDAGRVVGAVRISAPLGDIRADVHASWLRLALIGAAVVAAGLALAWFLAGSVARPVERLELAAERLGAGDLEQRVEPDGPRELSSLGRSFNRMARALAANIAAQRDFVANASHQLRTPLTGIKLRLEAIRGCGGDVGAQAARAESELDRLGALVDDLLALARASSSADTAGKRVDLAERARAAIGRWSEAAAQTGHDLTLAAEERAVVWADPRDVDHVLDNLIENAIRYASGGARIAVETAFRDGSAALAVADSGPGISAEERERIFERFFRGENGRRTGPGTGLGLAIVAELVERWDGRVRLVDGAGTRIEAEFPPPHDER